MLKTRDVNSLYPHFIPDRKCRRRSRNQEALRTRHYYDRRGVPELGQISEEQLDEFKVVLIEAIVDFGISGLLDAAKKGVLVAGSTGTAQGKHYVKLARDLGADNAHFLEAIEKFSNAKGKPEMARALNGVIDQLKLMGDAAYKNVKAEHSRNGREFLLKYGNFMMVFVKQVAPDAAKEMADSFPSLAVDLAKKVGIKNALKVASPVATFIHDMRLVGYTNDAIAELDIATEVQLRGVKDLRDRMETSVKKLKEQRAISVTCMPRP